MYALTPPNTDLIMYDITQIVLLTNTMYTMNPNWILASKLFKLNTYLSQDKKGVIYLLVSPSTSTSLTLATSAGMSTDMANATGLPQYY